MKKRIILILVVLVSVGVLALGIAWYVRRNVGWRKIARIQVAIQASNYEEAARLAGQYVSEYPDNWQGYWWQATAYARLGRYPEARASIDKVLMEVAAGRMKANEVDFRILKAGTYSHPGSQALPTRLGEPLRREALDSAIRQLEDANDVLASIQAGDEAQALNVGEALADNFLRLSRAHTLRAMERKTAAGTAKAAGNMDRYRDLDANSIIAKHDANMIQQYAMRELLKVVRKAPSHGRAAESLVTTCLARNDRKALQEANDLIVMDPNGLIVRDTNGVARMDPNGVVLMDPNGALRADPPPRAHVILVIVGLREKSNRQELQRASNVLAGIVQRHPEVAEAKVARARLLMWMEDFSAASQLCEEAIKQSDSVESHLIRADLLSRQGKLGEAAQELFSQRKRSIEAEYAYALAQDAAGERESAKQEMQVVLGDFPTHAGALWYMATTLEREGYFNQAFEHANNYYEARPDDPIALQLFVTIAKRSDQPARAREALTKVLERRPNPWILTAVADGYETLGDREKALQTLRAVDSNGPVHLAVARVLVRMKLDADAEPHLDALLADGNSPLRAEALSDRGRLYMRTGRALQAVEQFRSATQMDPANTGYRLELARALFEIGELEECQGILDALPPTDREADLLRLQVQIRRGEAPAGNDLVTRLTSEAGSGLRVAAAYLRAGQPARCRDVCLAEANTILNEVDGRWLLGQAYLALREPNECVRWWKAALTLAPSQMSVYQNLAAVLSVHADANGIAAELGTVPGARREMIDLACGWVLERQRKFSEAAEWYRKLAARTDVAAATRDLATMYRAQALAVAGQSDQALAELKSLERNPALTDEVAYRKAVVLIDANRPSDAAETLGTLRDSAVKRQNASLLGRIVPLYVALRKMDDAVAVCGDLEKLRPYDPRTHVLRANVLARAGQLDGAAAAWEKAIAVQPANFQFYVALAGILDAQQKSVEVLKVYDRLASQGPAGALAAWGERGRTFARWGVQAEAVKCFEKVAGMGDANSPALRVRLGQALAALGQNERAAQVLREVPAYSPESLSAAQMLVGLAQDANTRLRLLDGLEKSHPELGGLFAQRMAVLAEANRPADALKVFGSLLDKAGKDGPLPPELSYQAVRLMLDAGDRKAAEELAARLSRQTASPAWRGMAVLLVLDGDPKAAEALLPDANRADMGDAILGLCAAFRSGNPQGVRRWADRMAQFDQQGRQATPPAPVPAALRLLVALVSGAEPASAVMKEFKTKGEVEDFVAADLAAAAKDNPKVKEEAVQLLKVMVAARVGLPSLGATWAMDALKARPTCQWAAALAMGSDPSPGNLRRILELLQPKDGALSRVVSASLLTSQKQYDQAAAALAEAAQAGLNGPGLARLRATSLELAGKLPEALALYRQIWESTKDPVLANNVAFLLVRLHPKDPAKLSEARALTDEAVKAVPGQPAFRDTLGWILHLQGQKDSACVELRRAVKGLPGSAEVHYHLGLAEAAAGNQDLARWHLDAAVRLGEKLKAAGRSTPAEDEAVRQAADALAQLGKASP